jgi:hypothetical protein
MKTQIYPSKGIAQSAAARELRDDPRLTIKIEPVKIGFALTIQRQKPMRAKSVWIKLGNRRACTQVQKENINAS